MRSYQSLLLVEEFQSDFYFNFWDSYTYNEKSNNKDELKD